MTSPVRHHRLSTGELRTAEGLSVEVCVPVHNARDDVERCLTSVVTTRPPGTRLLVVDDGSAPETRDWLLGFAREHDDVTLLRNDEATGYTRAANSLLEASDGDLVLLLNSDTLVPPGWVERLSAIATASPDVGLVGPLSNAASWQSLPDVHTAADPPDFAVNELPAGWSVADMDFVVAATPSAVAPRVPLLNGFCFGITRHLIEEIGRFDAEAFPRGYGEENDYCFRASDAGAALVLATDTYVFHAKSRSFTHEGRRLLSQAGSKAFRERWPKRRIDNAIQTMREHPVLQEKRELVRSVLAAQATRAPSSWQVVLPPQEPDLEPVADALASLGVEVQRAPAAGPGDAGATGGDPRTLAITFDRGAGSAAVRTGGTAGGDVLLRPPSREGAPGQLLLTGEPDRDARRIATLLHLADVPGLLSSTEQGPLPASPRAAPVHVPAASPPAQPSGRSTLLRPAPPSAAKPLDPYLLQFDAHPDAIAASRRITDAQRQRATADLSHVMWFVPSFDHVLRGGIRTIFMLATDLAREHGTKSTFVLCGNDYADPQATARHVEAHFPELAADYHAFRYGDDVSTLPDCTTAVCTLWTTAYVMLGFNRCSAKYYLVQDWEPTFYAAGTRSGLIEESYRFGYPMLANSPGVGERCRQFDPWVQAFVPGVDTDVYRPDPARPDRAPYRVVFYGRPRNSRNGFELGVEALRTVKATLGDDVDIVSAGAEFDVRELGLQGVVRNLGVLPSLADVASLYRSAHVGLVFMYTAHPSYQPLEFMASGCVTVTNHNPYNAWLLRGGDNCALTPNTVSGVAHTVVSVLQDAPLRRRLADGGLRTVAEDLSWPAALAVARRFLASPAPATRNFLPPTPAADPGPL